MARTRRRSLRNDVQKSPESSPLSSTSPPATIEPEASKRDSEENCPACPAGTGDSGNPFSKEQWVRCDVCMTWYHWRCVGSGGDVDTVDKWYCIACLEENPNLSVTFKAPARKSFRKRTQRDYANLNSGLESDPRRWLRFLEQKSIKEDPFKRLTGPDVGLEWLEEDPTAMTEPVVIEQPDGLGMTMPSNDFTVDDVAELVGEDTPVEVIDVASQSTSPGWTLGKWNDYFNLEPEAREKICNVISLEISGTKLADKILPPRLVRDLDWVENYWPSTRKGKGHVYPKVQLYCLMGVANAWTDWHVDFAGSSVYYHILSGSKIFYFIRPTSENLVAYERWSGTELQNHSWLGDMVDDVYKVELSQGNTMIIPAGWIHAVYTPVDTLVFGGNFLHSYDVGKQLRVRKIEIATQVPKKFRFPMFSKLCWYVGDKVLRDLKSPSGVEFSNRVLESMRKLADFLVSEVRTLEGSNEAAKKEVKEQIPADRVKDAAAMARELRWRLRLAGGNTSEDEGSQNSSKPKVIGSKRKRTTSLSPALEEPSEPFRNFRPKGWDRVVETSTGMETKSRKGVRPDGEHWAEHWTEADGTGDEGEDAENPDIRPSPSQLALRETTRRHAFTLDSHTSPDTGLGALGEGYEPPQPPAITLMQHDHQFASELPPQYAEYPDGTNNPQFDTLATSFSAIQIGQPGPGAQPADPVPRVGSSMSMRSLQNPQFPPQRQPRNAATLPIPNHGYYYSAESPVGDGSSLYSAGSRHSQHETERNSTSSYEDAHSSFSSPESITFPNQNHGFQQPWQPPSSDYNPLYAAASNVLGMGPPPGGPSGNMRPPQPMPAYPAHNPSLATSQSSLSNYSVPFPGQSGHHSPYASSVASYPPPHNQPNGYSSDSDPRPPMQRGETSASVTPSTHKSKAVDLSAPPFTKEYIDQYRHRIKADPDPEAHFLYAKYLIDAARHIRTTAKDQRSAKKYSEILIGESLKVIRRLATQGEAYDEAQFFLANCYGTGALGLQVDHERAYHLYLQAAKQNHAAASYRVAVCNEIGAGTRREPPRAAAFYRKAASLGDTPAMYKLGMILLGGLLGEQKNPREAINWLKRAAEQADVENPHALHELALLHEVPNSTLVPYDPAYARSLFTQAAQLGYTPSQFKLGQCFEYGTLSFPVDPRRSIAWYTKAAEKGDSEAELALSGWYLTGSEGVLKQSDSEAYLWARRAANKGLSKAEYAVGYYAEVGIGIKQDIEFAKRWYMRAAAQGNKRAMNRLTEMKRMGNKRTNVARPTRQQAKDECVSLLEYLDLSQLACLNENPSHTLKSIVASKSRNQTTNYLSSDADEQLLLNIPFNQSVRVRSIVLYTSIFEQAPRTIKLAVNRPSLGFGDIEDAKEPEVAQVLILEEGDVKDGNPVKLRFVRFQTVNSLHIFVGDNHGDEETTRIDAIDIFGVPVETTKDLSGLRKQEE
ncbi:hypothetical protein DXG01_006565 [Tephrocybe rancida]|nr:hypothetical protein DXG01_006565 [Tephrocybe rancida]